VVNREKRESLVYTVDDQEMPLEVVSSLIEAIGGHIRVARFRCASDVLLAANQVVPDLLVTDYRMPQIDGIELIGAFRALPNCAQVPICMITSIDDRATRIDALKAGATDFMLKPADPLEVQVRITNLLTLREQQLMLMDRAKFLEGKYVQKDRQERARRKEAIMILARAGERRDTETGQHLVRMAKYSRIVAEAISMPEKRCNLIEDSSPLHDIGKLGIPDSILRKPSKHTPEEWRVMQSHTIQGYEILKLDTSDWEEIQLGSVVAKSHHERFGGGGYPENLRGEQIPMPARIVAIGDCFDALTSERPYKEAWSFDKAKDFMVSERGKHFDPELIDAFFSRPKEILNIHDKYSDQRAPRQASDEAAPTDLP